MASPPTTLNEIRDKVGPPASVTSLGLGKDVKRGGATFFRMAPSVGCADYKPSQRKSYTLPIFNLNNPYSRSFHLSWLGFFVAFLSWFAFPPLLPGAIKDDLKLTQAQIGNSNIVALVATLFVRVVSGPLVDRYGPRKVMAVLQDYLYLARFHPLSSVLSIVAQTALRSEVLYWDFGCDIYTVSSMDVLFLRQEYRRERKRFRCWLGKYGGGAAFAIMVSTYSSLRSDGLSEHSAWRVAFAVVPVPILLSVAALTLLFGQDHPAGAWSQRHNLPATAVAIAHGHHVHIDADEQSHETLEHEKARPVETGEEFGSVTSVVDFAVNESLTFESGMKILASPLTWLPALAYLTTFGFELALDGQMENVLFTVFKQRITGFDQNRAGYYTSIFGFLNLVTRPFGGYLGDVVYRKYGTKGKKYLTLLCGLVMGVACLAGVAAIFSEIGNGANFSLVPHCNSYNNGVMTGIVGGLWKYGRDLLRTHFPVPDCLRQSILDRRSDIYHYKCPPHTHTESGT
ncbi:major facilitator superfamily domain-containing protein [Mycena haematopus]|nr:major facilitator superfamily domain-containing protein [Mycena haematopus]